jgi:Transglutaminase-like superfamily
MTVSLILTVGKFFELPRHDRRLLLEAVLFLVIAALAIAWLPFRYVGRLAARPIRRPKPPEQTRQIEVTRVRRAIIVAASRVPWRTMCFQQGLAAQLMLRRRGFPSTLFYGASQDNQGNLSAHVWVRHGDVDVLGGELASSYALLATFPPRHEHPDIAREVFDRGRFKNAK